MRAHAKVVVERRRERSRCTTLRSAPPLTLRATSGGVHLVGSAAGPIGGDDLRLDVAVAAGASLTLRSVAAQLVLPSPRPAPSRLRLAITVGAGGVLRWQPEPTVIVRGADHRATVTVDLAPDADLEWRDEVVLGRDGEPGGSLLQRLRIERGGRPLLCTEVAMGPVWPTSAGPAGTGGARVLATTLLVGSRAGPALARFGDPARRPQQDRARSATLPLAEDAVLLTALGDRLDEVRRTLVQCAALEVG